MPLSTRMDNLVLDLLTGRSASLAAPNDAGLYWGLSSTTPTKAGANITEPSGGAYARVLVDDTNMSAASGSSTALTAEEAFAQASADWLSGADLTYAVAYDDLTSVLEANFVGFTVLTVAKPVLTGDTAKFLVGDLTLTLGGS